MDGIQEGLLSRGQAGGIQAGCPVTAISCVNWGRRYIVLAGGIAWIRFHDRFVGRRLDCASIEANGPIIVGTTVSSDGTLGVGRSLVCPQVLSLTRTYI